MRLDENGCLECLVAPGENRDSRAMAAGEAVLVAHFLGIFATSVGLAITLQLLQGIWSELDNIAV